MIYRSLVASFLIALFHSVSSPANANDAEIPRNGWMQYVDPTEAGFDVEQLKVAEDYWKGISSSAFMVVVNGKVLVAWGDVERRFMLHSVRKSLLAALYGIYWDRREIDLNTTLADLGIDDHPLPLLESERQARILDLLKARSGVFHPSAYGNYKHPVARGSQGPGRYYAYNNWDFNTLGAIFEQETGKSIFNAFDEHFAEPLGMEDWRVTDGYYHYERDKSRYPAYPFRMSTRDAARIGLLFARDGMWADEQILSKYWIQRATALYSDALENEGYGFMWWIHTEPRFARYGMYSALGVGTQMIAALPKIDMVVVNRANTYERNTTPPHLLKNLIEKITNAKVSEAAPNPRLKPLQVQTSTEVAPQNTIKGSFAGSWTHPPPSLGLPSSAEMTIQQMDDHLIADITDFGYFKMYPQVDGSFLQEDSQRRYIPIIDESGEFDGLADSIDLVRASIAASVEGNLISANAFLDQSGSEDQKIGRAALAVLSGKRSTAKKLLNTLSVEVSEAYAINLLRTISEQLFLQEHTEKGLDILILGTDVYQSNFASWFLLAQRYFMLDRLDEATKATKKVLEINEESPDALLLLERINRRLATR